MSTRANQSSDNNINQLKQVADLLENIDKILAEYNELRKERKILRDERDKRLDNFKKKINEIADILPEKSDESSEPPTKRQEVLIILKNRERLREMHSKAIDERIKFLVEIQDELDNQRKLVKDLHTILNINFLNLLAIKQNLQNGKDDENLKRKIGQMAITRKMEQYKKIRDLLEMEIIGLLELRNLRDLKEVKAEEITLEADDDLLDKIENEQLREPVAQPVVPPSKEDKAKSIADEMKSGLEEEVAKETDKVAKEHGLAIFWAIIKKPVVGLFTGIVAFFYRGIIEPLILGYEELKDAWNSIKVGKIRSVGNGLLKATLVLGATAGVTYGLALGFIAVGVVALLSNPFTWAGIAAVIGVIVTVAIATKLLERVFVAAKIIANKVFDREYEAFLPSKSLIKLKGKQAYEISAFFRREINEVRGAIERAPYEREKKIHREILTILENTYRALNAISVPANTQNNPEDLLEVQNKYKAIWEDGFKQINEKHQQLNHLYVEKHVIKMNDDLNEVLEKKSKKPEQKASAINSMAHHNRGAILHKLNQVQQQWNKLEQERKAYVQEELPERTFQPELGANPKTEHETEEVTSKRFKGPKPPNPFDVDF